jgi:hypothetical protein
MHINYPAFWIKASYRNKRIYAALFIFVIAIFATVAGFFVPPSLQDSQQINQQLNQTLTQGKASGTLTQEIFLNNFALCLVMFIPLVGAALGFLILFNTGQAFRAALMVEGNNIANTATTANFTITTVILALVLIGATFLCEYISYSIGISESIWLFRRLMQRRWREAKVTAILIGVVTLLLTVGAIVETLALTLV